MRSPRVRLRSQITPSTWWNSARCVRSTASLRNTRSMEKYFAGRNPSCASLCRHRAETAVVCVRRMFLSASARFHAYWCPMEPCPPTSCIVLTRAT